MVTTRRLRFRSGGYTRAFTPHGKSGKRYLVDDIPAGFWARVRVKAKAETISLRGLILGLLKWWLDGDVPTPKPGARPFEAVPDKPGHVV